MPSPVFIKQLALTRFQGFQIKLTLTKGTVGTTLTISPRPSIWARRCWGSSTWWPHCVRTAATCG